MLRMQVQFTEEQAEALRREARRRGVSVAAVVRQAVDAALGAGEEEACWRRAMAVVGSFADDERNVAREHDRYLEDALRR
ncbi:MAG TPA: ribbon-helix-helix protein, CopG family [Actinomycetota bacterium]|nr:ribbon-helix-helix protein, CopG family [Actinomycetota bacterium]